MKCSWKSDRPIKCISSTVFPIQNEQVWLHYHLFCPSMKWWECSRITSANNQQWPHPSAKVMFTLNWLISNISHVLTPFHLNIDLSNISHNTWEKTVLKTFIHESGIYVCVFVHVWVLKRGMVAYLLLTFGESFLELLLWLAQGRTYTGGRGGTWQ